MPDTVGCLGAADRPQLNSTNIFGKPATALAITNIKRTTKMKTLIIALAASAALATGAQAANTSFSDGDGFVRAHNLDREPTASIGAVAGAADQVYYGEERIGGRQFNIRYTLNGDGSKNILSKSAQSSND